MPVRAAVMALARAADVSPRSVWRWMAIPAVGEERTPWQPSEDDVVVYARWCANASAAWRERRAAGVAVPSLRTFQAGMATALTRGQRAGLRAGERARREFDAYLRWEPEARNDVWEADHKQLDIDVVVRAADGPVRPWLTLFVEGFSRVVPGWALSIQPSAASILAAFGAGVSISPAKPWGGVPVWLRVDQGADFLGAALEEACGRLGVILAPVTADCPFLKGKVEAAGKNIDRGLLPPLPGYRGAGRDTRAARSSLLSFTELVELVRVEIDRWNRTHVHPVLGCPLAEAWERDATPLRTIDEGRLRWMMLAEDHRIVQKEGVRFAGHYYTAPELTGQRGRHIRVLYWPHDERRIEVMVGEEWLCTAWPQGALSRVQRDAVLAERRRQKLEVDRLRRRAVRRVRRRLSPATITDDAQDTTVITADEVQTIPSEATRVVSLLRLETDG